MKMKSILVSMLAIAALASCTRQEFIDPPGPGTQGEKMLVDVTLTSGELTKATGVPTANEDRAINDITVFFLNATDQIVSRHYVLGSSLTDDQTDPTKKTTTIETRTTATQMMVIANIGEDRTGTGANTTLYVSTREQLVNVVQDLVKDTPLVPVQTKGKVLMSGEGTVSTMTPNPNQGDPNATAAVTLDFISAKITLSKITVGSDAKGTYGTDYKFTRAFLLNVQRNSHYFPTADSYIPTAKGFVNGVAWGDNWGTDPNNPALPVVADFNETLNITDVTTPSENIAHWYVFENDPAGVATADNPTILVVEVEWTKVKGNGAEIPEQKVKKMFNVIFGPGDKGVIKAGQAYNVELTFNGDFRPESDGGTGGGGSDNPDQPNVSANVAITVTPASWQDATTPKPFE